MACAYPYQVKNQYFNKSLPYFNWNKPFFNVPCGMCLNCRIDKRNSLEDECNYEYNKYGSGAFITLTYDDNHIEHLVRVQPNGDIDLSLDYRDYKHFRYRLKSKINRLVAKGVQPSKRFNPLYKMLCVSEYGGQYGRPHFHILFFGLDYTFCKNLFKDCWKNGFVDVRPILNGGIRYVLKYLDKRLVGEQARLAFDNKGLERPRCWHSRGLGSGMYLEQLDYLRSHNFCYKTRHNKLRPVRKYWRDKLLGKFNLDNKSIMQNMKDLGIKPDTEFFSKPSYSLNSRNDFMRKQALLKENNRVVDCRNHGEPVFSHLDIIKLTQPCNYIPDRNVNINNLVDTALYGDVVPF